jgi:2-polyprenyl-6-methoxyphenol hydroxylase-like FAD-dependent oxidoreductase
MLAQTTQCCIAGGGPAGIMLGFLLARAGVDTIVLEKHADFFRDFRGDTIHPSTLDVMAELGLLDEFLRLPHQELRRLQVQFGPAAFTVADFAHVPTRCKFVALMPQWDFLNFMSEQGKRYPGFRLEMNASADDVIVENGRVAGVRATLPEGPTEIRAALTIAADGRGSTLREKAGLIADDFGAPMDVLWMRISRNPKEADMALGRIDRGRFFIMINRGTYWQCAYVIRKGAFASMQERGLDAFRDGIRALAPNLADRVDELQSWDDVKLLTVKVDRLRQWYRPGLLCIGDAAHAMSPIGGVGINLAIQDAVAAGNILGPSFASEGSTDAALAAVQKRREWPARMTQKLQLLVQSRFIDRMLDNPTPVRPPLPVRLAGKIPLLRTVPAYVIGVGFRPEHVRGLR